MLLGDKFRFHSKPNLKAYVGGYSVLLINRRKLIFYSFLFVHSSSSVVFDGLYYAHTKIYLFVKVLNFCFLLLQNISVVKFFLTIRLYNKKTIRATFFGCTASFFWCCYWKSGIFRLLSYLSVSFDRVYAKSYMPLLIALAFLWLTKTIMKVVANITVI